MTTRELRAALSTLGWSQAKLARNIDVHANTIGRWIKDAEIPGPVAAYVRLVLQVQVLAGAIRP